MLTLRPYQRESLDALYAYWQAGGGNGLVVIPTGGGKSLVIATLVRELLENWPSLRIGIVTHVRELVAQNMQEMLRVWPGAPVGIYSAGLGRRDAHARILFCGIQSVWNKVGRLGAFDVVIVDEAHLIPRKSDTMYGRFLEAVRDTVPDMRIIGLTATPYRLDSGRLDAGEDALFERIVYEANVADLIDAGYLSPLVSKGMAAAIDVSGVQIRGGEFVAGSLESAALATGVVPAAVSELIAYGQDRRAWLAFCTGVTHAIEVRDEIRRRGVTCEAVHGELDAGTRDRTIRDFREGRIRCLTSVAVLTTGFNVPHVDLIAMLRPTLSTGLYVQIVGRGFRTAPGKENCLILDFAGNVRRHGPVDAVEVKDRTPKGGEGGEKTKPDTVRAKQCPECSTIVGLAAATCPTCGHAWPREASRHEARADADATILSRGASSWLPVTSMACHRHTKLGAPDSLRLEYVCGISVHREWLSLERDGYARDKAGQIWRRLGGRLPVPSTVTEALQRSDELEAPDAILIKPSGKFYEVIGRRMPARENVA